MMVGRVERMRIGEAVKWRGRDGRVERGHVIGHERTTATIVREDGDANRPRARGLTRNRLQGQGCHDGRRVTRLARFVVTPRNVVIHLEV